MGNGCTDDQFDGDAIVPFIYGMGLISMDMYKVSLFFKEYNFIGSDGRNRSAVGQSCKLLNLIKHHIQ